MFRLKRVYTNSLKFVLEHNFRFRKIAWYHWSTNYKEWIQNRLNIGHKSDLKMNIKMYWNFSSPSFSFFLWKKLHPCVHWISSSQICNFIGISLLELKIWMDESVWIHRNYICLLPDFQWTLMNTIHISNCRKID